MFAELCWAAGFFDGEGSTMVQTNRRVPKKWAKPIRKYLRINIGQVDSEVLLRFQRAVGVGQVSGPYSHLKHPTWKPIFHYIVQGADAKMVLDLLWPYLSEAKKAQALQAISRVQDS